MLFHHQIKGMFPKRRQDARGMAKPNRRLACSYQTLEQVVHRQIAGSAGEHLVATADRLTDKFDNGGRLAGARRTVDDCQVVCG